MLEVHPERVHPEAVEVLGIAHGDVTGDAFVEPELAEQPERRRQALLAVEPLLLEGVEARQEGQVGKQCSHAGNVMPARAGSLRAQRLGGPDTGGRSGREGGEQVGEEDRGRDDEQYREQGERRHVCDREVAGQPAP